MISQVNSLGTASVVWFVVPALMVVIGLRRQHPVGLAVVTVALTAVGVTMYDAGPVSVHLTAIFVAVVVLAGVGAALVLPAARSGPGVAHEQ